MTQMTPEEKPSGEYQNDTTRMKTFADYLLKERQKSITKTTGSWRRVIFSRFLLVPLCLILLFLAVQLGLFHGLRNLGETLFSTLPLEENSTTNERKVSQVCGNFLEGGITDSMTLSRSVKLMYGNEIQQLSFLCFGTAVERWRVYNI